MLLILERVLLNMDNISTHVPAYHSQMQIVITLTEQRNDSTGKNSILEEMTKLRPQYQKRGPVAYISLST